MNQTNKLIYVKIIIFISFVIYQLFSLLKIDFTAVPSFSPVNIGELFISFLSTSLIACSFYVLPLIFIISNEVTFTFQFPRIVINFTVDDIPTYIINLKQKNLIKEYQVFRC